MASIPFATPCYDPTRTVIIQQLNGNVLVRGNIPLHADGTFAYDSLNIQLQSLLPGLSDLKDYTLLDISLMDNQGELTQLRDEFAAFGAGAPPIAWPPFAHGVDIFLEYGSKVCGQHGALRWMPVQGCIDADNCAFVEPSHYNFPGIVRELNYLMTARTKAVIYLHCMNGFGRAGSVTACYQMRFMGRTRQEAMCSLAPEGAFSPGHPWHPPYAALIQWYASTIGK